ncbi:MAG: hypothetical protein AAB633_02240 [Patescibacteria group bacterium]
MNIANKYTIKPVPWSMKLLGALIMTIALLVHSYHPQVVNAKTGEPIIQVVRIALPIAPDRAPRKTVTVLATAYNSVPWQTDNTPFITASGTRTRHGVVAANFLPIGAHVRFPEVYGDTVFTIEDRMNKKYYRGRVDIWMEDVPDARIFGAKRLTMEVF